MKICLVGLNNRRVKQISGALAKNLTLKFVDLQKEFDAFLIKSANYPLALTDALLRENETRLLTSLAQFEGDFVAFIPADMFLSNQNYKQLKGCTSVAITVPHLTGINANLQNLVCRACRFCVDENKDAVNSIIKSINA